MHKERKMIVSAPSDYREAARHRLPQFLFDYIDGGAVAENTMNANAVELSSIAPVSGCFAVLASQRWRQKFLAPPGQCR
jgi:aspartate ammonia-lyase